MSRRLLFLVAFSALFGLVPHARAITGEKPEFKKLADGVYAYVGKRNDANALVVVTSQGVVLVDTGNNPPDTRAIQADIKAVTNQPVRFIVVSQNHGDHVGGIPYFAPPATVIAQERVAENWARLKPYQIAAWRKRFPERTAALRGVNPLDTVVTFGNHMHLHLGGRDIDLLYVEDRYNPGDVAVWLPKEGVLHGGFAGYIQRHPDIRADYSHGTTAGILKQLDALIPLKPKILIPAHGPLGGARDLQVLKDYLVLARQKVRTMMDKGMPLPAIEKAFDMHEYKDWDRTEHLSWTAATIYREFKGLGPEVPAITEKKMTATIAKVTDDGRFITVTAADGSPVALRMGADADVEGVADRTLLRPGMKVSVLYQIAEGTNAALGHNVLELDVAR